ncbi:MAG: hypothetical protein SFX18_09520 [Pirellulales bacterium]|nr:hypothetical protein [Pirellulales bacterium]
MTEDQYQVERRADGAIVVRVRSQPVANKPPLPDAVFCFHAGDPQYDFWSRKLSPTTAGVSAPSASSC